MWNRKDGEYCPKLIASCFHFSTPLGWFLSFETRTVKFGSVWSLRYRDEIGTHNFKSEIDHMTAATARRRYYAAVHLLKQLELLRMMSVQNVLTRSNTTLKNTRGIFSMPFHSPLSKPIHLPLQMTK